jgi:uncharacterized membrane protein
MDYLHHLGVGVSMVGVLIIVYGVMVGLLRFVRSEVHALNGTKVDAERRHLRHLLGYYLLLGLEFLIAADIIETLMKPTVNGFNDFIVLGSTIVVRTVISWSLDKELKAVQEAKIG